MDDKLKGESIPSQCFSWLYRLAHIDYQIYTRKVDEIKEECTAQLNSLWKGCKEAGATFSNNIGRLNRSTKDYADLIPTFNFNDTLKDTLKQVCTAFYAPNSTNFLTFNTYNDTSFTSDDTIKPSQDSQNYYTEPTIDVWAFCMGGICTLSAGLIIYGVHQICTSYHKKEPEIHDRSIGGRDIQYDDL